MTSPAVTLAPRITYRTNDEISQGDERELRRLLSSSFPLRLSFRYRSHLGIAPPHHWLTHSNTGEIIAHAAVFDRQLRTECGPLAVGGIAQVCVKERFRGNGLTRAMLGEIHHWLAAREIPFAILFGKPTVYRSSGYREANNQLRATNSLLKRWNPFRGKLLICPIKTHPWPHGVIDLNGPSF